VSGVKELWMAYLRLLAALLAMALAIRWTYELLHPVFPWLVIVAALVAVARFVHWYRNRW
jgi:hypothetical protein